MTNFVGEMKANFPLNGTNSQPFFIAAAALLPKRSRGPAPSPCTHQGIPTANPRTHIPRMKTLPQRTVERRVVWICPSPRRPIPKSFANVAKATATTSANPAAASAMVNFAATTFTCIP